jgi:ketosteroid isomerase-like protein
VGQSFDDVLEAFDSLYRLLCDKRDAVGAMALWASDDDVALFGSDQSDRALGQRAVREHLEAIAGSSSTLVFVWHERYVHIEGDAAWVSAIGTLTVDSRASTYQVTAVFVWREGRWLWHTHSGSEPRAS